MKKINKETRGGYESYKWHNTPTYPEALIVGNGYYNPDIWATPMPIPENSYLGLAGTPIHLWQIPFDHTVLKEGDVIVNEDYIGLIYLQDYYILTTGIITRDSKCYLTKWFCKWEKQVK